MQTCERSGVHLNASSSGRSDLLANLGQAPASANTRSPTTGTSMSNKPLEFSGYLYPIFELHFPYVSTTPINHHQPQKMFTLIQPFLLSNLQLNGGNRETSGSSLRWTRRRLFGPRCRCYPGSRRVGHDGDWLTVMGNTDQINLIKL